MKHHYSDMFEGIHEDDRLDTVYLDFAKAYNSQPAYLIKRVLIQKIKGNIEKMVKNFLRNKKILFGSKWSYIRQTQCNIGCPTRIGPGILAGTSESLLHVAFGHKQLWRRPAANRLPCDIGMLWPPATFSDIPCV